MFHLRKGTCGSKICILVMGRRLFIYYLTQKSLPNSMIYQTIQISGLFNKESNSARRLFVK